MQLCFESDFSVRLLLAIAVDAAGVALISSMPEAIAVAHTVLQCFCY